MDDSGQRRAVLVKGVRLALIVLAGASGFAAFSTAGGAGHGVAAVLGTASLPEPAAGRATTASGPLRDEGTTVSRSLVRPQLDPRFASCLRARAAGYGPYVRNRDVEYRWYPDADGDGVACDE